TDVVAPPNRDENLVQDVQEMINLTRRTEQRVRGLQGTVKHKQALWAKYVEDMKHSFIQQFSRHQRDMEKLQADLDAALSAQEESRAHLRMAALGEQDERRPGNHEAEWNAMVERWRAEQREEETSDAVLRRALAASVGTGSAPPATPPRRVTAAPAMTPPAFPSGRREGATPPGLSLPPDPYQVSPSRPLTTEACAADPLLSAGLADVFGSLDKMQRPKLGACRKSIKEAMASALPESGLNAAITEAVGAVETSVPAPVEADTGQPLDAPVRPVPIFADDDSEEDRMSGVIPGYYVE
ncbi:unnamed protein product, partial [Symbiodinium sp. CCMP2456]